MDTLEERRNCARLNMAYKILNGHVIINSNMLPRYRSNRSQRQCNSTNVGYENRLVEPPSILQSTGNTFFYSVQKIWNQRVTPLQACAPSVDAFKGHFKK